MKMIASASLRAPFIPRLKSLGFSGIFDNNEIMIEVYYVGSREKAPY